MKRKRLTIEDAKLIAENKGGECLSEIYNSNEKLEWKCVKGHIWKKCNFKLI